MTDRDPKLSHSDAIVVFADLQSGTLELPLNVDPAALLRSAEGLARLAELFDIPTLVLTIPKRDGAEPAIAPEITHTRRRYRHFQRTTPDSFDDAAIRRAIAELGRSTLIVGGVATEVAVHWLVLSGLARGYNVYVVTDACGGLSDRTEQAAFARFAAAGATMTSVVSLAGELAGDMTRSPGSDAVELIYRLIGS